MPAKFVEGDTVSMDGEVTRLNDDGTITVHLHGYGTPVTTRAEHLTLITHGKPNRRTKPLFDAPD